jgi:exoribonuclease-2
MGLPAYTTFTSPIRRYLDLITIRQFTPLLDGGLPVYNEPELEEISQNISAVLKSHNHIRFSRKRYWLYKYMAQFPDKLWEVIVLDRTYRGFSLVLLDTMLRAVINISDPKALEPGQRTFVRIIKINPMEGILHLELA